MEARRTLLMTCSPGKMRLVIVSGLVILYLLLLLSPVAVAAKGKWTMTSSTLKNPVTLDGKWTLAHEWTDGASFAAGTYGWLVIKDDDKFLYVLVDYTTDRAPTEGDFAWVVWDQRNDGGSQPKTDDYELILTYTNKTSYSSSAAQGTGTGWGTSNPASSLGILSASSTNATADPHSKTSHLTYEFQVPRSILDNSTVVTSIGFYAGAFDAASGYGIFFPLGSNDRVPNTWAQLRFSVPVPEFPSVLVMVAASVAAVGFVSRRKRAPNLFHPRLSLGSQRFRFSIIIRSKTPRRYDHVKR